MKKLLPYLLIICIFCVIVLAENNQPTQQFNKIYLAPFYRESMALNTNYTYTVTINPPDKITSVLSAIISFNAQINGQSQNFTLWVNGQKCNTPNYYIATAFSTTGNAQFSFDCTNIINQAGTYTITLRSAVNTGAMSGWAELTYMNNPTGGMSISGTEYSPGDEATMFLQLKDSQGTPVSSGACYLDIWWPKNSTNAHPYTIQDAPMLQALGDDGIYYYDMIAPSILGVYMLSAKCSYSFNWIWIYPPDETVYFPDATRITGTWTGSSAALNSMSDSVYERCDSTPGILCQSNYTFNVSQYGTVSNITSLNLYFSGYGDNNGKTVTFAYWNGTAFVNLPNILTVSASGTSGVVPVDQFLTNSVPTSAIINNMVIIRYTGQTGIARLYNNWLSLALLLSSGTIQDLKGSGEMHITNLANATVLAIINNTGVAQQVWAFPTRNLTYYNMTDTTNYTAVALQVWVNPTRNLTYYQNDSAGIISGVWSYTTRNLTYYQNDSAGIISGVWSYTTRNLTYYNMSDTTNYSRISNITPSDVWTYATRNLTYYPNDTSSISIAVWNYATRNLTFYPTQLDLTNYSKISNLTASDVWSYTNRNLTYYAPADTTAIALAVWNATTRNLTYYPAQSDLTNYTLINEGVWAFVSRTLTQAPENLSAISYAVWNATTRDLTFYPTQLDLTNYTRIPIDIWNYGERNLTFYPVQIDMTNYSRISNLTGQDVWEYTNRNLTYYPPAYINVTEVADGVWNYTGVINVNILSQVATAIWDYVGKYVDGILG